MANQHLQPNFSTVELSHNIQVQTSLPPSCHAPLRAGFAGYTDNPRWTPQKRRAWKQGRQWRSELAANQIAVENGLLQIQEGTNSPIADVPTPTVQMPAIQDTASSKGSVLQNLLGWSRKKPLMN